MQDDTEESPPPQAASDVTSKELVTVTPYVLPNPGPYPQVRERANFTGDTAYARVLHVLLFWLVK